MNYILYLLNNVLKTMLECHNVSKAVRVSLCQLDIIGIVLELIPNYVNHFILRHSVPVFVFLLVNQLRF